MTANNIRRVLEQMFPVGMKTLPSFASLTDVDLGWIDAFCEQFPEFDAQISNDASLDINEHLSTLKKLDNLASKKLIEESLRCYFSHPDVASKLNDGHRTLFPNYRTLPDIDYDLLIPVFERGVRKDD